MRCPRCGSENVSYQVDSKVKHSFWWGFKGQTTTYAVCQNCGKRWKRNPFEKPTNSNAQTGYSSAQTVYGYNQGYVYGTNTFCQSCGTQLNGGNFCPNCGQPVTQPLIPPNPIQVPQMNINLHRADQEKRFNNIIIGVVLFLFLWAFVFGAILIFGNLSKSVESFVWFLFVAGIIGDIIATIVICIQRARK